MGTIMRKRMKGSGGLLVPLAMMKIDRDGRKL